LEEKQEKIQKILDALVEESNKGTLVVVEGKKDVSALRSLGLTGPILSVKTGGQSFIEAAQEIEQRSVKEVILLLDFDRRGKQGTLQLKQDLERAKIKPNLKFWQAFAALFGRENQCVEGIPACLENLQKQTGLQL
jgi:5S rRNA maturation endonuclease (ribonuclease M5)